MSDEGGQFELKPGLLLTSQYMTWRRTHGHAGKPVLVVHGRDDEAVAVQNAREIAAHLPAADCTWCPGLTIALPAWWNNEAITIDWLERHSPKPIM